MTTAVGLWVRVAVATMVSTVLLLLLAPPRPALRLPWTAATIGGLVCGALLYIAVTRCRPRLPTRRRPVAVVFATQAFLALLAANEEIVWRRVVLGELLEVGVLAAMLGSTIGFALMHRSRRRLQLATGAVFGVLYVSTGALVASVAAHWAYNALVGALVDRGRAPGSAVP